jgi:assimilatory nitrate reductase catalytic subunit
VTQVSGPDAVVATTCPYCGVGCGVMARRGAGAQEDSKVEPRPVEGDRHHPASFGRLCVKGTNLHETIGPGGRLLNARVKGQRVALAEALDSVAERIRLSIEQYGPESVAFYLSGQLLTEDYYVANKLAKGFIRTPHVDTNSRLCMSSAVAAHKRAFGADVVPGCYEDLELADLLVLMGSNAAWNHPVLYQRMKAAARDGRRVVVIDPRRTATSELADLHLTLRPGTDTILFNGLLVWLADHNALDHDYLSRYCGGLDEALASAREAAPDVASVATACDLASDDVATFYRWFAETPRTVTGFSQGANQSVAGTDKGNAIINCHLATGRVGKPGASPFSLTGQPNAMGGREVGGLANTLAAHMDYQTPGARERVAGFWQCGSVPEGPGLKAVDMFDAVLQGKIRVLWIMATNPAVSLPDSARVREALKRCDTVIVSDCVDRTDTSALADIVLPAAGWGEKDGTVTNSERRISRQRAFLPLPGEARPDWWLVSQVGVRLGHADAFGYRGPRDIFCEHAALTALDNHGSRPLDLSGLATLDQQAYDQLDPIQWPVDPQGRSRARLFGEGGFATPDGRARLVPVGTVLPVNRPAGPGEFVVNTGRIRDQWHTMTRTARSPRLLAHREEPFVEMHPQDMARSGLEDADLAELSGAQGRFVGRVRASEGQRAGEVFVPIHWNRQFSGEAVASQLIAPVTDPVSGQPESKHGVARINRYPARWHGRLMVRRDRPRRWRAGYWSHVPLADCDSWWLADVERPDWSRDVIDFLGGRPQLMMQDVAQGRFRAARLVDNRLEAILLVDDRPERLPDIAWLASCFGLQALEEHQRRGLLSGKDLQAEDIGKVVCSCFGVGDKQITAAVEDGCDTVGALGDKLQCGTNCGSCIPELKTLIDASVTEPS